MNHSSIQRTEAARYPYVHRQLREGYGADVPGFALALITKEGSPPAYQLLSAGADMERFPSSVEWNGQIFHIEKE